MYKHGYGRPVHSGPMLILHAVVTLMRALYAELSGREALEIRGEFTHLSLWPHTCQSPTPLSSLPHPPSLPSIEWW